MLAQGCCCCGLPLRRFRTYLCTEYSRRKDRTCLPKDRGRACFSGALSPEQWLVSALSRPVYGAVAGAWVLFIDCFRKSPTSFSSAFRPLVIAYHTIPSHPNLPNSPYNSNLRLSRPTPRRPHTCPLPCAVCALSFCRVKNRTSSRTVLVLPPPTTTPNSPSCRRERRSSSRYSLLQPATAQTENN